MRTCWRLSVSASSLCLAVTTATRRVVRVRLLRLASFLISTSHMRTPALVCAQPLADAWALDTAVKPYKWQSVQASGEGPCARMYAAAAARADGLLLLCGGRDGNNMPLVRSSQCRAAWSRPDTSRDLRRTYSASHGTVTDAGSGLPPPWWRPPRDIRFGVILEVVFCLGHCCA